MRFFSRGERTCSLHTADRGNWRKATRSWANGDCVEIGQLIDGAVSVRDSGDRSGPVITFDTGGWDDFLAGVRSGRVPPLEGPGLLPSRNA
jgi:Domain of unknown function (DUF397)